jgi:hypothetical protein
MAQPQDLEQTITSVSGRPGPILSAQISVNADILISEECLFCGRKTCVRPLTDVLVDLTTTRGARLDFMLGENENTDTLRAEFGGIAGLTRL